MSRWSATLPAALLLVTACGGEEGAAPADDGLSTSATELKDGSPEGIGLLAFLNDAGTTAALLDGAVGLDKRAAGGLISHRDGRDKRAGTSDDDLFGTIGEVDAVPYVGESALSKLAGYASTHGFVPASSDVLGVFDEVSFTVQEADATLVLANTASEQILDGQLGLDRRAVASILKARPIATVLALSKLSYVGTSALQKLKAGAAKPALGATGAELHTAIQAASTGLWHTSESDYPLVAVLVPGAGATPLTVSDFKDRIAPAYVARPGDVPLADREVEVVPLSAFFDRYTQPQGWWEQSQLDAVPAWQALEAILRDRVTDAQLFRVGYRYRADGYVAPNLSGAIDLFVVGRSADGAIVGFSTVSVET